MEKLTERENDVLEYVKKYMAQKGYPPAIREIMKGLDLSSPSTIHAHLKTLMEKGYLKQEPLKKRSLVLNVPNEWDEKNENVVDVPLLGKITAGSPIEAIETPDEYFSLPANLIPTNQKVFTLKVSGESMINAGILDGDTVIIQKQENANNGDIVAAMTEENEVTLKRFYKESDYVRLQPENDTMAPIILPTCKILGKAVGLYRNKIK